MTDVETQLSVSTGSGVLLRADGVVLFVPEASDGTAALIEAIRQSTESIDATFDRIADLVVELEFAVPDFVCVGLSDRVQIRVFGNIEVITDLASAPMLSGAGSSTWVEHRAAFPADGSLTISVSADSLVEGDGAASGLEIDLVEGLIPSGGFRFTVRGGDRVDTPAPQSESAPAEISEEPHPSAGQDARVAAAMDALGDPQDPAEEPAVEAALASDIFDDDLIEPNGVQAADAATEGAGEVDSAKAAPPAPDVDPAIPTPGLAAAHTIVPPADLLETPPPPAAQTSEEDLSPPPPPAVVTPPPPPPATGDSVMARPCPSGHSNRPSRVTCSVCDAFLPSGQDALELMNRPPVGHLIFSDGTRHVLDKDLLVGRAPVVEDGVGCDIKVIRSDQISRRHLAISVKGWDVFVEDCGSRNGTVLIPTDGAAPVKVEAGMPQLIEPGASIHFADQVITLAAVGSSPIAMNGNEIADG